MIRGWRGRALMSETYVPEVMPRTMGTFDLTMVFMLFMFFISNPVGTIGAGAVSFIYWIVGALVFFLPTVIATAQLAKMFPYEGSTYNWTHKALGGFWSFFASVTFWMPGVLGMIGGTSIGVSFIQGLNSEWLTQPWQQGLLIICILVFAAVLSLQRFRMLLYIVNFTTIITYAIVGLIGLGAVIWLFTGHQAMTVLNASGRWSINAGNLGVFATITLAYIGADVPLIAAAEGQKNLSVKRALFWGMLIVLVAYLIVTFALMVLLGGDKVASFANFSVIAAIEQVFGKVVANLAAVGIIAYFPVFVALNSSLFARLLMTTSIDRRLPIQLAKLNKNRVPSNAIIFQTIIAIVFVAITYIMPYLIPLRDPAALNGQMLVVTLSMLTLVWAVSSSFLFIDLFVFWLKDRAVFKKLLIVPMPIIWWCIIVAPLASIAAIVITLLYSPIPTLISNDQWRYLVGSLTVICIFFCVAGSMVATSEAQWQDTMGEEEEQFKV